MKNNFPGNRRDHNRRADSFSSMRRRWTDGDEDFENIDAKSVAYFSELAIRSLRSRNTALSKDRKKNSPSATTPSSR